MKSKTLTVAFAFFIQGQLPAIAQDTAKPVSSEVASIAQSVQAEISADSKVVPKISVHWDCGSCEQNPKVAPLLQDSYRSEAFAKGYEISTTESAEITIKEYGQRKPALRVLFGVFSGKDKLATTLSFRGKEYAVEDYSVDILHGMNSLCQSVARQSLAQVLSALKQ